jgi:hypothetical protein
VIHLPGCRRSLPGQPATGHAHQKQICGLARERKYPWAELIFGYRPLR